MPSLFVNSPALVFLFVYSFILIIIYRPHILISTSIILFNFLPFLLNDLLFPSSYMSDQFRYLDCAIEIRNTFDCKEMSSTVKRTSYIFAFTPIPVIDSVYSIAVINRFFYLCMIHILLIKHDKNISILFILTIYSSILIYSSVALRDNFLLIGLVFFCLSVANNRSLLSLMIMIFVGILKPLLAVPLFGIYLYFLVSASLRIKLSKPYLIILYAIIFTLILSVYENAIVEVINLLRIAYFGEDISSITVYYVPVVSLASEFFPSILRFLFAPSLFEANNMLQVFSSIENIIVFIFLIIGFYKSKGNRFILFPVILLFLTGSVISLIVINEGTLTRYIYPIKAAMLVILFANITRTTKNDALNAK